MFIDSVDWSFMLDRNKPSLSDQFAVWLYGEYDESKYQEFTLLYSLPHVRDYMDMLLDRRSTQEYLDRYGMDYSDIHDPRKLRSTGSTSRLYGSGYTMISRNLSRLYK